jgi:hypothetical protein
MLLPEALATGGSVALLLHLVKRAFGGIAGLLAAPEFGRRLLRKRRFK